MKNRVHKQPISSDVFSKAVPWLLAFCVVLLSFLSLYRASRLNPTVSGDDVLSYYTINQPTLAQLLHFQKTTPVSLEPPAFEAFAHVLAKPFGYSTFSVRMASIFSWSLLQLCLFATLRRFVGNRVSLLAMLFPMALGAVIYATHIRPYAFEMAMAMAALLCWVQASREARWRVAALAGLAASIALAATSQFYGVLIVLPIALGEIVRSLTLRSWKISTWMAIIAGSATVLLDLPYRAAAKPYTLNLVRDPWLGIHSFGETYAALLRPPAILHRFASGNEDLRLARAISIVTVIFLFTLIAGSYRYVSKGRHREYLPEWTAFCALTLIPLPVVAFACWSVGTYAPRHGAICVLGVIALGSFAVAEVLRKIPSGLFAAAAILLGPLALYSVQSQAKVQAADAAASLPSAAIQTWLMQDSSRTVYMTVDQCIDFARNVPVEVLDHFRCLISERSMPLVYLSELSLRDYTSFPVRFATYEQMTSTLPTYLAYRRLTWENWILKELDSDGIERIPIAEGMEGTLYKLSKDHS